MQKQNVKSQPTAAAALPRYEQTQTTMIVEGAFNGQ